MGLHLFPPLIFADAAQGNHQLFVPVENEAELRGLAKAANHAVDRMIKNLDETIAYVHRVLKQHRNGK